MLGRTLSHYQILDKLGEGGMGTVWKARDTRLNRLVAIKVLPPDKLANPDRKHRFIQEAQAASALNHPNIVTIYDVASDDGIDFMAMEYIAGVTLDRRVPRQGMRLAELLDLAIQIADALAKAHAAGIVHRDLKPGNIMVTGEGRVKLLDFGLAKLTEPAATLGEDDATRTVKPVTEDGAIVGTISYMSPEQAEAKPVDARSDIFSFGAVLYEMATGTRAFRGDSKLSTLSAILRENPKPAGELAPDTPRDLDKIIARCLRKDPARRFQYAADLKVALAELKEESESGALAPPAAPKPPAKSALKLLLMGAVGMLCIAAAAGWVYRQSIPPPVAPPKLVPLTTYAGNEEHPSFSPDGSQVAFSWNGEKQENYDIYVKLVDGGTPLRLTTNPAPDTDPAWSPDGRWIAFLRDDTIYLIAPLGGPERRVADVRVGSVAWMPDSQSLLITTSPNQNKANAVYQLAIGTGEMRRVTTPDPTNLGGDFGPAASPDGKRVAFAHYDTQEDLYVTPLEGGEVRRLTHDRSYISGIVWANDREIVFSSARMGARGLWRIAADGKSEPQPVPGAGSEAFDPAIAHPANSPPRLAYQRTTLDFNIWRTEVAVPDDGTARTVTAPTRFTASTRIDSSPQYSPDGKKIAFSSDRSGYLEIWAAAADGSNPVELTNLKSGRVGSPKWSPDGQRIVFDSVVSGNNDVWMISSEGGAPRQLTKEPSNDARPSWSQDGRWIYFRSDRSGAHQIWKMPASEPYRPAVQVTRNGAYEAIESVDGKLLYFNKVGKGLWSVPAEGGEESLIMDGVQSGYWAVSDKGIYFVDLAQAEKPIEFLGFANGKLTRVGAIDKTVASTTPGFTVTRDGRWIAWSQVDREESDLMLLENFR